MHQHGFALVFQKPTSLLSGSQTPLRTVAPRFSTPGVVPVTPSTPQTPKLVLMTQQQQQRPNTPTAIGTPSIFPTGGNASAPSTPTIIKMVSQQSSVSGGVGLGGAATGQKIVVVTVGSTGTTSQSLDVGSMKSVFTTSGTGLMGQQPTVITLDGPLTSDNK